MATATASRRTMAMAVIVVVLVILPRAAVAKEGPVHRALFDHIQEIRALSENAAAARGEVDVEEASGDWIGSLGVAEEPRGEAEDRVEREGDAASDLFAHIYAVQRRVQEAEAEAEVAAVNGEERESEIVEGVLMDGMEEKEKGKYEEVEVEDDGVVDPLVQGRFKVLEAALKSLKDPTDGRPKELRVQGAEDGEVVNLLENYAREANRKLHPDGASRESQLDNDQSDDHGNHERLHRHGHDHGHAHATAGFSRASDAHYRQRDRNGHSRGHQCGESIKKKRFMLPEEIAEEEDLLLHGFEGPIYANPEQPRRLQAQELGVWLRAMGCTLLVSLASLICLVLLPCIVSNRKPSETVINALASFGAGAMLGDVVLHQLPHAFGISKSPYSQNAHQHHHDQGHSHSRAHGHDHSPAAGQGHAHSLQDLSIGLAVLGGILLFFIVEKIVRRYEGLSSRGVQCALDRSLHHHQVKENEIKTLEGSEEIAAGGEVEAFENKESKSLETKISGIKKKKIGKKKDIAPVENSISTAPIQSQLQVEASPGFVMGYLNLLADAVHNFTYGMALGSAFLLHGTVGGWSRTLSLLAHVIPHEVGDFRILVKSGFSVFEAFAFNFLSASVALGGTAVALTLGRSLGHSSLIEGFIAGGFIYMSVGAVMHDQGSSPTSTLSQLVPMVFGMGVAVVVSLGE